MNKIILIFSLSIFFISCYEDNNNEKEPKKNIVKEKYDPEEVKALIVDFKYLYEYLLQIKDTPKFQKYGFGIDGPYNEWLKSIQKLKERPEAKQLLEKGVLVGDIEQLGLSYATSKGKETEVTKKLNEVIRQFINSTIVEEGETIEKSDASLENSNYEKLRSDYELFGKWLITNSMINQQYTYEIYRKGNKFVGVIPEGEFKTYMLEKKGKNYYVKDNRFGEYFRIDSKLNMTLFDGEGDLTPAGFIATKVE